MDSEVEKLAEKTVNLQIKKKAPKNWCDLPKELKEEVVKRVDFKSSLRLRQTARAERNLVDSRNIEFSRIIVKQYQHGNGGVLMWEKEKPPNDPSFILKKEICFESLAPFVAHILKVGSINCFVVDCQDSFMGEVMKKTESVRIKELNLYHSELFNSAQLILQNAVEKVECLNLVFHNLHYLKFHSDRFTNLCSMYDVKFVEFYRSDATIGRNEFSDVIDTIAEQPNLPEKKIVLRVKPNEVAFSLPGLLSLPVTTGCVLPTDDNLRNIVFEVSEPHSDHLGAHHEVVMHIVPFFPRCD